MKNSRGPRSGGGGFRSEKQSKTKSVKISEPDKLDKPNSSELGIEDDEYGFGGWLGSAEGLEMMKLFVIGNSLVILTTMSWPFMKAVYEILSELISGEETLY